ncbi:MAG: PAS domain-containing protein [Caldilineaceae bacterium]
MLEKNKVEPAQTTAVLFTKGADNYRILADAMPQIVYITDAAGLVDYVNQRWYDFTGTPPTTALGQAWTTWLHPDDQERVSTGWQASISSGQPFETEHRLRHVSGEYYWHLARALPIYNEEGQLTHWIGTATNIHSLKQTEAALSTNEQRLKLAQRAGGIATWELNLETDELFFEDSFTSLFGYTTTQPESPALETWLRMTHPQDLSRVFEALNSAKNGARAAKCEFRVIWPDGSIHWLLAEGEVTTPPIMHGITFDRTQAKETEEALRRSQARYQALIEASGQVIWSWDIKTQSWQYFDTLRWWESITGQSSQAQVHDGWLEVVHAEDRERMRTTWQQALATGSGYEDEYRVQAKDGTLAHIIERVVVVRDAEGEPVELVGTLLDVTQQRRAEQAAAANLRLFQGIAETTPDILFLFDQQNQQISYVNQAVAKLLGYSAEQIQTSGKRLWLDLLHPDDLQAIRTNYPQIEKLRDTQVVEDQYRLRHANGSYHWFQVHTLVFSRDAEGRVSQLLGVAHDISERKRALEALQESNQKIRSILESTSDAFTALDQDWRVIYANQHSLRNARLSSDEMVGQNFWKLFPHLLGTAFDTAAHLVMYTQASVELEMQATLVTGWYKVKFHPSPEGIVIYAQDISERKQAEARFYQVLDSAPNGIAIVDPSGKFQFVNPQVEQLLGYRREELLGQSVEMLVPPALRSRHPDYRGEFMQQPIPRPMGIERGVFGLHKDGHTIPLEISLHPIETIQGGMVLCTIVDISLRKEAETQLRQSEERLQLATEIGKIGVFDYDVDKDETQISPIMYEVTQFPRDVPLTRQLWLSHIHPDDLQVTQNAMQEALTTGEPSRYEYRILCPDQSIRWLETSTLTLKDEQGQPTRVMGVVLDISQRKEAEETLRRLNQSLEQNVLERTNQYIAANQELEAFAYSVSHDLRAPLRAMSSFSKILLDEFMQELSERPRHYLQRIHFNATQMGMLIDDLLAFSRLSRHELKKQMVAPNNLVHQAIADLSEEQTGRQIEIIVAPLPACLADAALLKQVFINLLSNALKYTRKRAVAQIEIGWQPGDATSGQNNQPVYFVRDNGVGFDMRYADKLFGVFQRLHSGAEYEGTGVGLATVQRIIHRHDGRVWAQAELDKGATVYFCLADTDIEGGVEGKKDHG